MTRNLTALCLSLSVLTAPMATAQTDETTEDAVAAEELLTQAEIETLVAPVALYPDTLLIQVLVASTFPLDIMKADRLLAVNEGADQDTLQAAVAAEGYDPSVEVLATAFPTVLSDMATHVEWTEAMGTVMLAQSDDVMDAVQTMRQQAVNNGALISGDAQTVEVSDENEVIIQPTDPEVVYVPQYDTQVVYADSNSGVEDALITGAVIFGTFAIMDAIFDNDDPWNDYWGCRNCGGWGGGNGNIIRSPDIDIDVDGNVNIGNNIDLGDKEWRPDDKRKRDAQKKIGDKRGPEGNTRLPVNKGNSRGDDMRANLARQSGAADISRPANRDQIANVQRPSARPEGVKRDAINKTKPSANRPSAGAGAAKRPAAKKPAVKKPAANRNVAHKAAPKRTSSAMQKRAPSHKARASSHRGGGAHRGGGGRGRR